MTTLRGPEINQGLITNWIALTTPGPPRFPCSSSLYFMPGEFSRIIAFDPWYGKFIDPSVRCLETEASLWWNQHSDGVTNDINLGPFGCPRGYATATISSINEYTSFAGCYPSEYKFLGTLVRAGSLGQCASPLSIGQSLVAKTLFEGNINSWVDTTVQVNTTGVQVDGIHINGFVFREQTSTLPASASAITTRTETLPTSALRTPSNTQATGEQMSTQTSLPSSSTVPVSEGLRSSAKIGTRVGVSLAVVGAMCLVAAIILWRRRARGHTNSDSTNEINAAVEMSEPAMGYSISGNQRKGLSQERKIHEMPGRNLGHEDPVEMWVSPPEVG